MKSDKGPGLARRFFGHKLTRSVIFVIAAVTFTAGLYTYSQNNGGFKLWADDFKVAYLNASDAAKVFNPEVKNLNPTPIYLTICDGNDKGCQLQLAEDEQLATVMDGKVRFYHIDPAKEPAIYGAIMKIIAEQAGQPIPQVFPMRTLWKTGFKFNGLTPVAQVGLVNLDIGMKPAGALIEWITKSMAPPKAPTAPATVDDKAGAAPAPDTAAPSEKK